MKLIGVPSSQGSLGKNLGCELAPKELLQGKEYENADVVDSDIEATDEAIFKKAKEVFSKNETPLFIGGDHSITYALVKAFSEKYPNPSLVIFDAHADADVFFKPVSHQDLNRAVIDEKIIAKENLLIIGLRKVFDVEEPFLEEHRIQAIASKEIHADFGEAKKRLSEFLAKQGNIYLSIDIDALDPAIAPGTGYREKDGLSEKEFFELLETILGSGKVKGADLVEINPKLDAEGKTINLGKAVIDTLQKRVAP